MTPGLNWPGGLAAAALLALAGWGAVALTRDHRETRGYQRGLFLAAFFVRLAASAVIYGAGLIDVLHDEDGQGWLAGVDVMRGWLTNGVHRSDVLPALAFVFRTDNHGYHVLLGAFFTVTRLVGRLPAAALNAFVSGLGVVLVYRTARVLAGERAARWVAAAIVCLPLMIIWSAQTIKEPVVITIEAAALYACVRINAGSLAPRHLWLAVIAFVLAPPFRFYVPFALGASLLYALWRNRTRVAGGLYLRLGVTAMVAAMLAGLTVTIVRVERPSLARAQHFRDVVAPGGAALAPPAKPRPAAAATSAMSGGRQKPARDPRPVPHLATLDVRKPAEIPLVMAIGAAYTLLAPFPWQFSGVSVRFLLSAPDMLIWWPLFFVVIVPGVWRALRTRLMDVAPLAIFLVLLGGLYSLIFANVGIAYRQRAQFAPVLLIMAAAGNAGPFRRPRTEV